MGESFKSERTVREYLLGRVSDEAALEAIEELLFTDDEFCTQVALAEDGLVNGYVLGHLDEADAASFRATLADNPARRFELELTQALREKALARGAKAGLDRPKFFDSIKAFFRRPRYAAGFALLLLAVLASAVYFAGRGGGGREELAELRDIYRRERPTETRISEFGYAPLTQLRGEPEPREKSRLRLIENSLIEAVGSSPGESSHHALGVFLLTQGKYADAIREFESALKFDDKSARIHNDLGAAYFELAKSSAKEKRLEYLAHALQEFTTAESNGDSLEALFNKSLALQEQGLPREAKQSWTLYLQKDSSSPWAEEARRHLARVEDERARLTKTDQQVLQDFLTAYRERDETRARKIHNETKGLLRTVTVPLQLSRRYLLARRRGDAAEARESVEAMAFIGGFERERHSEFFFLSWPTSTRTSGRIRPTACCGLKTFSTARSVSCPAAAGPVAIT